MKAAAHLKALTKFLFAISIITTVTTGTSFWEDQNQEEALKQ
jgi:hypothetical protein